MQSQHVLFIAAWCLLLIGTYGLIVGRNIIKIIIALQLMVKGALIMLLVAGSLTGQLALGESLAVIVISIDTLVTVIGLTLAVQIKSRLGTLDIDQIINLEG